MNKLLPGAANSIGRFIRDRRGNAAVEFALVVPLMLARVHDGGYQDTEHWEGQRQVFTRPVD